MQDRLIELVNSQVLVDFDNLKAHAWYSARAKSTLFLYKGINPVQFNDWLHGKRHQDEWECEFLIIALDWVDVQFYHYQDGKYEEGCINNAGRQFGNYIKAVNVIIPVSQIIEVQEML